MSKRDRAYFERRLKRDHPAIYKDLLDGKYASVREASIAAGLQKPRSPLQVMKSEWGKSTKADKDEFLNWVRSAAVTTSSSVAPIALLGADRKLLPAAAARIEHIRKALNLQPGQLMVKMGFKALDQSLTNALGGTHKIRPALEVGLNKLIADHAHL
ncbi:hypothetical protein [Methylopila sp. M107]|uniref:hypothetical protein n=1 Tax=Methylopila sp. M107 TaxID=1101190 RepID=UPI00037A7E81|nr:hypothetical protein [Methylopila sp. M107]